MRLLLAEDDWMIGQALREGLNQEGFVVDWVQDGHQAELALKVAEADYALLLLDLGLPRLSGLDLLTDLRRRGAGIPVLILTARDSLSDRVLGLNSGADDYLVKPFELDELVARIHALVRRAAGRAEPVVEHGPLRLLPVKRECWLRGEPVELSAREFDLLYALLEKPGAVLSRTRLEERVYGWGQEVVSNAIDVHIHHLRKKLGPGFIVNVRGVGYRVAQA
ncbi:response regulator transcription factor [Methylococcus capsulatus]|jgi:two-component system response regulator QseB|uniref:DNA-binding transcriptional activator QseB n=1 Tax=Methylococcus capsulatus TaxID=414 RepID=A0AA35Y167_METCP|nr:response regulator transcription factor [Methylococcus capsulatus]CAI8861103.1 DNA-binding transcriptional activator QseB [Methylococcus capsulatus]